MPRELKSPYEAETRNTDVVLIVLGGFAFAMWILAWAASAVSVA
jgi:hypothetical protein